MASDQSAAAPEAGQKRPRSPEEEVKGAEYWKEKASKVARKACVRRDLYLDTIHRDRLDFDVERVCSVSLSRTNVYACLVCGKYFQGRGPKTHAYFHSIDESHHVFMHLDTTRVYVLPDNYAVDDPSLADIQYQFELTFSDEQLAQLDAPEQLSRDLHARTYVPGFLGLNNTAHHEAINVVLQALSHVAPLRDFFLRRKPGSDGTELLRRFGTLVRRLWNPRAFKRQVSPHEFLQQVSQASHGRFTASEACDPVDFLGWLLNQLHRDLVGGSASMARKTSSIITDSFQGAMRLETQNVAVRTGLEEDASSAVRVDRAVRVDEVPFLFLAMDLPPLPVFPDGSDNMMPQVPLAHLLAKYDGKTNQDVHGAIRRHKIKHLPPYLILHFRRFTRNRFVDERNTTVVHFSPMGLDVKALVDAPDPQLGTTYKLMANITHEATAGTVRDQSTWSAQLHTRHVPPQWFQMHDDLVERVDPHMLFLGESYLQIWERVAPT